MSDSFDAVKAAFAAALAEAHDEAALYDVHVRFIGKKGALTQLRSGMAALDADGKRAFGQAYNQTAALFEAGLETRRRELEQLARGRELEQFVDLSLTQDVRAGSLHRITATRRALEAVFLGMGFSIARGPHVDAERYNFDLLNFRPEHPARDMQDTFFVEPPVASAGDTDAAANPAGRPLLRTHTSPVQVRTLLQYPPPLRIVCPGTVFRRDDDATHSPMFHQIEGLYVDRHVTMADLKATLERFVGAFFGATLKVRFRPSYFPFVEPGAEFDLQCPFCRDAAGESHGCSVCKRTGYIEIGGSGMIHPNVLEAAGLDPSEWRGWAFGFGIDRMAMMRHAVPDLRSFFEGDVRFLEQFPC